MREWRAVAALLVILAPASAFAGTPCSSDALLAPLDALRGAALDTDACAVSSACARAAISLEKALQSECQGDSARALGAAAGAVQGLERAGLLGAPGTLRDAAEALVSAALAFAKNAEEGAEDELATLCSGVRPGLRRTLARPAAAIVQAEDQVAGGQHAAALKTLGGALNGFAGATKNVAKLRSRCMPKPCSSDEFVHFTPGAPGNESLALVLPDKGTQLDYDADTDSFSLYPDAPPASGRFRAVFAGITRARVLSDFLVDPVGPTTDVVLGDSSVSLAACSDREGWMRSSQASESVRLLSQRLGGASNRASLRFAPPVLGYGSTFLDFPPTGAVVRVGDRIDEPEYRVAVRIGSASFTLVCSSTHEVEAIEAVTVPAGSFEKAARIHSTSSCALDDPGAPMKVESEVTFWVVSGLGAVRSERTGDTGASSLLLACFEVPETAGSCGAF